MESDLTLLVAAFVCSMWVLLRSEALARWLTLWLGFALCPAALSMHLLLAKAPKNRPVLADAVFQHWLLSVRD